jgi:hypothetical protein
VRRDHRDFGRVLLWGVIGIGWIQVGMIISNENVGTNCSFLWCCLGVDVVCLGSFGTRLVPLRSEFRAIQRALFGVQSWDFASPEKF